MISKLCIILTLCTAHPVWGTSRLQKAQDQYHNSIQYKEWQKFKEEIEQEKILEKLLLEFFDSKTACLRHNTRFGKKCPASCFQADIVADTITAIKNKLYLLEENALQTKEAQEYFCLLRNANTSHNA